MPKDARSCMVYLDGAPRMVPWKCCCADAARGTLGLRRGEGVARELGETGKPDGGAIALTDGWEFHEGERFVTGGLGLVADLLNNDNGPRPDWQGDPDGWKGE